MCSEFRTGREGLTLRCKGLLQTRGRRIRVETWAQDNQAAQRSWGPASQGCHQRCAKQGREPIRCSAGLPWGKRGHGLGRRRRELSPPGRQGTARRPRAQQWLSPGWAFGYGKCSSVGRSPQRPCWETTGGHSHVDCTSITEGCVRVGGFPQQGRSGRGDKVRPESLLRASTP